MQVRFFATMSIGNISAVLLIETHCSTLATGPAKMPNEPEMKRYGCSSSTSKSLRTRSWLFLDALLLALLLVSTHLVQVSCFQINPPSRSAASYRSRNRFLGSEAGDGPITSDHSESEHTTVNGSSIAPQEEDLELGRTPCNIVVCGVGGGGGNAVNHMIDSELDGVTFWAINTDAQALAKSKSRNKLNIGRQLTRGLGAGGDPKQGAKAAVESTKEMKAMCEGADMVFITAGE